VKQVGVGLPRVDALAKVLGEARFGADFLSHEPLHLKVVRSPKPHARIVGIESDEAVRVSGVERIFTAQDIPGEKRIGPVTKDQPVLASDRVRHVGDPVAVVAADTIEAAEEGARRVVVAYEDLGPEAVRRLEVEDLPVIVVNDVRGNDLYVEGEKKYRKS